MQYHILNTIVINTLYKYLIYAFTHRKTQCVHNFCVELLMGCTIGSVFWDCTSNHKSCTVRHPSSSDLHPTNNAHNFTLLHGSHIFGLTNFPNFSSTFFFFSFQIFSIFQCFIYFILTIMYWSLSSFSFPDLFLGEELGVNVLLLILCGVLHLLLVSLTLQAQKLSFSSLHPNAYYTSTV